MVDKYYHKSYYKTRMDNLKQILGGRCARCGSTENLEFDHIDRTTKSFNIAKIAKRKFESIKDELDKCELLCSTCHKLKSKEELQRHYLENGSHCSKRIDQINPDTNDVIHTYDSMREAARAGFILSCISDCCAGKKKIHRGFLWRYHLT